MNNVEEQHSDDFKIFRAKATIDKFDKKQRSDSWTVNQEKLLKEWSDKAVGYRWLHLKSHELYEYYNMFLAYPIIILSGVAGVGGLSSISGNKPSFVELVFQYVFFSCNILVSIISSIQRFNGFTELSEKHSQSAIEYSKFYRYIKMELSLDPSERIYGIDFCKTCKLEFDKLLAFSPEIPSSIIRSFNIEYNDVCHKPDITNILD